MKILILSDTHLTHRFDQNKFDYIKSLIAKADQIILNGDFWDYYYTDFDTFMNSEWKGLFPYLKAKKTIYVFGNHDKKEYADGRIYEFCEKAVEVIEIKSGDKTFRVEHGHHVAPSLDLVFPQLFRVGPMIIAAGLVDMILIKMFRKKYLKYVFSGMNETMRSWKKENMDEDIYLICGHSHYKQYIEDEKYINLGLVRYGLGQYVILDEGKINRVDEIY